MGLCSLSGAYKNVMQCNFEFSPKNFILLKKYGRSNTVRCVAFSALFTKNSRVAKVCRGITIGFYRVLSWTNFETCAFSNYGSLHPGSPTLLALTQNKTRC